MVAVVDKFGVAGEEMRHPQRADGHAVATGALGQDGQFLEGGLIAEEDIKHRLLVLYGELVAAHMLFGLGGVIGHIKHKAVLVVRPIIGISAPAFIGASLVCEDE